MSIVTDQATVDRWVADGRWVEFAEGLLPYADPCPCDGPHSPPDWSTEQRLAVQVPCDACGGTDQGLRRNGTCHLCFHGRKLVARATVEWGPLPVVEPITIGEHSRHETVVQIGRPDPDSARLIERWVGGGHSQGGVTLPPDVDPSDLIGQWARGGTIEATP